MNSYQKAYNKLNIEQKKAVTTTEGPVMVLAGPGTGKTQVLGTRIGYILENTDTQAHNILCLTYTDAGVVAMRERLIDFIGKEAFKVNIHTFHSFCNRVISENPEYFSYKFNVSVANELQQTEALREMIDRIPKNDVIKRLTGQIYYDVKDFKNLFSYMKKENLTAELLEQQGEVFMKSLDDFEDFYYKRKSGDFVKGDKNINEIAKYQVKVDKLISASKKLKLYDEILAESGLYDFDDMINWVVNAFDNYPDLLLDYQEQFLYIMVDEFQDTNGIQLKLLNQLCSYWEETPNVFVVGDDDQAIYRFQGANVDNLRSYFDKYQPEVICLDTNYRSRPEILKSATNLVLNNQFRMNSLIPGIEKLLQPFHEQIDYPNPQVQVYSNIDQEDAAIIDWIEAKIKLGAKANDIAIISRNHNSLSNIVQVLQKKSIPVFVKTKLDVLKVPIARNLLTMLRYIDCFINDPQKASIYLCEIMQYPSLGIQSFDVLKTIRYFNDLRRTGGSNYKIDLREIISSPSHLQKAEVNNQEPLLELAKNLEHWMGNAKFETIQILFEKILVESKILLYILNTTEKINLLESVNVLFNFIKEESAKDSTFDLNKAIATIDKMEEYGIILPFVKIAGNLDGVQLMTAHATKGLEYKNVWIKGADSKNWENARSNSGSFMFSELNPVIRGLIIKELKESKVFNREIKIEDERRLFFVAVTRAKDELVISYAPKTSDKKETPSQFLTEIFGDALANYVEMGSEEMENHLVHILRPSELTKDDIEKEYLDRILSKFSLSCTALNNFLECPLKFYYSNIMRIPQARSSAMGYGNVAHKVLERLWRTKKENGTWPETSMINLLVQKFLAESMEEYHSHFNPVEFENYMAQGEKMLPKFVQLQLEEWHKIPDAKIEYKIDTILENIPLTGKLDRVDVYSDYVHVTDYKTGKFANATDKLKSPKNLDHIGGDYWRQVVFYKILLDLDSSLGKTMTSGSMDFVEVTEKDKINSGKFIVSPEEIEIVTEQIKTSYNKIMNHEFYSGCGKPKCYACNMAKNIQSLSSLGEDDLESEFKSGSENDDSLE